MEKNLVRNILWHFIPATLSLLFIAIPTLIYSILQLEILSYVVSSATINIIKLDYIHLMLYLILALQSTSKYGKALKGNYSNLSKQDVNWVKTMLIGTLAIIAVYLAISIYELLYIDFIWYQEYLITVVMIILISYLGYYGVNQSKILFPDFLLNKRVIAPKSNRTPLSGLKRQEFESLKQKLEYVLLNQKPYLDEDLTLGKLAEQLSVKDKELSMLLNQYMRTSFFDLINKYRVDAIKKKIEMETYERYTLYGIACECGFKSRTSFNRVFKRETGLSPSDYKKKYL
ncbi:MAG: helix-turn-helix domain-containing protein [Bacteroidota bacterium]